ncbi:MAG: SAM-dependent methyltransferase, partial [Acidimicrobiia bacterium]
HEERRAYANSLATVTERHGTVYVLCFGGEGPVVGPHPVSPEELRAAFASTGGWKLIDIEPERIHARFLDDGAPGWLATFERT